MSLYENENSASTPDGQDTSERLVRPAPCCAIVQKTYTCCHVESRYEYQCPLKHFPKILSSSNGIDCLNCRLETAESRIKDANALVMAAFRVPVAGADMKDLRDIGKDLMDKYVRLCGWNDRTPKTLDTILDESFMQARIDANANPSVTTTTARESADVLFGRAVAEAEERVQAEFQKAEFREPAFVPAHFFDGQRIRTYGALSNALIEYERLCEALRRPQKRWWEILASQSRKK